MNISKGYKLVPVELLESLLDDPALVLRMSSDKIMAIKSAMLAAPTPPQPTYDEAKEQYAPVMQWSDDGVNWMDGQPNDIASARSYGWQTRTLYSKSPDIRPVQVATCASCDGSGSVCIDWDSGSWTDCPECAQSRAKAVEAGHE